MSFLLFIAIFTNNILVGTIDDNWNFNQKISKICKTNYKVDNYKKNAYNNNADRKLCCIPMVPN